MLTTTITDECLIEVSIAINATISTGVVCTEIYAGNTTARIALVLITFDIELPTYVDLYNWHAQSHTC